MENKYYKLLVKIEDSNYKSILSNGSKLSFAKDKFNTKNTSKKQLLVLPPENERINLLINLIGMKDYKISYRILSAFFKEIMKEFDIEGKGSEVFDIETYVEISKEDCEYILEGYGLENGYFNNIDKKNFIKYEEEYYEFEEVEAEKLEESKSFEEAYKKLSSKLLKEEIDKLCSFYSVQKNSSAIKNKVHYIFTYKNGHLCRKSINLFIEMLYYKGIIKKKEVVRLSGDSLYTFFPVSIFDSIMNGKEAAVVIEDIEKLVEEYKEEKEGSNLYSIKSYIESNKGNSIFILLLDENNKEELEVVERLLKERVKFRKVTLPTYSDKDILKLIKESVKQNYKLQVDKEGYENILQQTKEKIRTSNLQIQKAVASVVEDAIFNNIDKNNIDKRLFLSKNSFLKEEEVATVPALEELNNLIGLEALKKKLEEIINYFQIQNKRRNLGYSSAPVTLHMEFTGNPGTCKTTVARIIGKLMKEKGILRKGDFYEVGREELVGKYVGWTAPTVVKKVREALGSVLFIDEAYSLYDGTGSYGDEAIAALIKEMENHREDVMIILAGYPKEMEKLIESNPGFKDRIAFKLDFPNYNTEELKSIFNKFLKEEGYEVLEEHLNLVKAYLEESLIYKTTNFGNGRFMRKAFERLKLIQSSRIVKEGLEENIAALNKFTEEDFKSLVQELKESFSEENLKNKKVGYF